MRIIIKDKVYTNDCSDFKHYDDLIKLQSLMEELGYPKIDLDDILWMWEVISDKYYASWLGVPCTKEDLVNYLEEIEVRR